MEEYSKRCYYCGQISNYAKIRNEIKEFTNNRFEITFPVEYFVCKKCRHKIYPNQNSIKNTNIFLRLIIAKILKEQKFDEILESKFPHSLDKPEIIAKKENIVKKVKHIESIHEAFSNLKFELQIRNIILKNIRQNQIHKRQTEIKDLHEFIKEIFNKYSDSKPNERIKLWYRGQKDSSWGLIPGAFRKESEIFLEFKKYEYFRLNSPVYNKEINYNNNGELLAFMQHYGVNTRLLDWTESPLCALYFAVNNHDYKTDAAIFCFDIKKLNSLDQSLNGSVPILNSSFDPTFNENYIEHGFYDDFFPFELNPVGVMAAKQFDRIHNQQGNFTIHTNSIDMYKLLPDIVDKYIIPKEYIKRIQSQLYILGINETMFFNEIEKLANISNNPLYINSAYEL